MSVKNILFVLGGNDGEMAAIATLLSLFGLEYVQPKKEWGEHRYTPEDIGVTYLACERYDEYKPGGDWTMRGERRIDSIYFVECQPAEGWKTRMTVLDHHGSRAGEPPAIKQVIDRLDIWAKLSAATQRWVELVAANDAGYIPAMQALGATPAEIERVRAFDRASQGVTPAQEAEAEQAIKNRMVAGRLTTVRPAQAKCAPITDRLHSAVGGVGYDQLLILAKDGEANFFGDGALCVALKEKFEGWSGGSGLGKAGEAAFWGGYPPGEEEVICFIADFLYS